MIIYITRISVYRWLLVSVAHRLPIDPCTEQGFLDHFAIANPPSDVISAVQFSPEPESTRFVVSSWDKNVYLYDLRDENGTIGEGKLIQKFEHRAPVLDVCFGQNEDELYTAGLDWDVKKSVSSKKL